ncbi:Increased rDNA silencing protein [Saitoella coloradoensis]
MLPFSCLLRVFAYSENRPSIQRAHSSASFIQHSIDQRAHAFDSSGAGTAALNAAKLSYSRHPPEKRSTVSAAAAASVRAAQPMTAAARSKKIVTKPIVDEARVMANGALSGAAKAMVHTTRLQDRPVNVRAPATNALSAARTSTQSHFVPPRNVHLMSPPVTPRLRNVSDPAASINVIPATPTVERGSSTLYGGDGLQSRRTSVSSVASVRSTESSAPNRISPALTYPVTEAHRAISTCSTASRTAASVSPASTLVTDSHPAPAAPSIQYSLAPSLASRPIYLTQTNSTPALPTSSSHPTLPSTGQQDSTSKVFLRPYPEYKQSKPLKPRSIITPPSPPQLVSRNSSEAASLAFRRTSTTQTSRSPSPSRRKSMGTSTPRRVSIPRTLRKPSPDDHGQRTPGGNWKQKSRSTVTEEERKRYEGIWAANKIKVSSLLRHDPEAETPRKSMETFVSGGTAGDDSTWDEDTIDPLVLRELWNRSRLPSSDLAQIFTLIHSTSPFEHQHAILSGYLSREEFLVGMWLIDGMLAGKKLPKEVAKEVWESVGWLSELKIKEKWLDGTGKSKHKKHHKLLHLHYHKRH